MVAKRRLHGWLKRAGLMLVAALVALSPLAAGPSWAKDTYQLKAITAFPKDHPHNLGLPLLIKLIEQKSGGRLKINWIGGPEVIQTFDQGEALRRGTVDMLLYSPFMYFGNISPVFTAKGLSEIPAWEERQSGAYDLWVQIFHEKMNAEYLGCLNSVVNFKLFLNKKISTLAELKGLKIRVAPLYTSWMKSLGANPITIPPMEIYTAMERGVVDGFLWPNYAVPGMGWHEVTKFMVNPGVFQLEPATVVNLDKFKALPPDLQKVLKECVEIMEGIDTVRSMERVDQDWKVMSAAGMQIITLPEADAKEFVSSSQKVTWAYVIDKAPDFGPELYKLTRKKP